MHVDRNVERSQSTKCMSSDDFDFSFSFYMKKSVICEREGFVLCGQERYVYPYENVQDVSQS